MGETVLAPLVELIDPKRKITYGIVQPGPRQPEGEGVPLIRGQDYSSGMVRTRDLYWVLPEISAPYQRSVVRPGDLLISIVGYVGAISEVPAELDGANLTQTTARLAVGPNADSRFLLHALRGPEFQAEVRRYMKGSAQPGLNLADVERMRVRLPPLEEQRRIAEILDTIDETIQATERVIAKLRSHRIGAISDELNQMFASSRASIVDDEFDLVSGITLNPARAPRQNATGYLRVANVHRGRIDLSDVAELEASPQERAEKGLRPGDLLVVEGHANPNEIGRCASVPLEARGLLYQNHLFRLRARRMRHEVAELILNSPHAVEYWRRMCSSSSGLNTINSTMLRTMPIPVPDAPAQDRLTDLNRALRAREMSEEAIFEKLQWTRMALASDLLSGRVRAAAA